MENTSAEFLNLKKMGKADVIIMHTISVISLLKFFKIKLVFVATILDLWVTI